MKTGELTGALLDYWVARAEGFEWASNIAPEKARGVPPYSTDWVEGGPLIERYGVELGKISGIYLAFCIDSKRKTVRGDGFTPLQAICRAVVRAKFGDEVPDLENAK